MHQISLLVLALAFAVAIHMADASCITWATTPITFSKTHTFSLQEGSGAEFFPATVSGSLQSSNKDDIEVSSGVARDPSCAASNSCQTPKDQLLHIATFSGDNFKHDFSGKVVYENMNDVVELPTVVFSCHNLYQSCELIISDLKVCMGEPGTPTLPPPPPTQKCTSYGKSNDVVKTSLLFYHSENAPASAFPATISIALNSVNDDSYTVTYGVARYPECRLDSSCHMDLSSKVSSFSGNLPQTLTATVPFESDNDFGERAAVLITCTNTIQDCQMAIDSVKICYLVSAPAPSPSPVPSPTHAPSPSPSAPPTSYCGEFANAHPIIGTNTISGSCSGITQNNGACTTSSGDPCCACDKGFQTSRPGGCLVSGEWMLVRGDECVGSKTTTTPTPTPSPVHTNTPTPAPTSSPGSPGGTSSSSGGHENGSPEKKKKTPGLTTPMIAGIAGGGFTILAVTALLIVRNKRSRARTSNNEEPGEALSPQGDYAALDN